MSVKSTDNRVHVRSKSDLAVRLSRLKGFYEGKVRLEQYATLSEIAADLLWNAYLLGDIEGKVIVDLGCGTGILGIGALLLGAKKVYFVEIDENALNIAKSNLSTVKSESLPSEFILGDIGDIGKFEVEIDTIVQNPPFGVKVRHNDRYFLENAFKLGKIVYSLHKSETKGYLEGFSDKKDFEITHEYRYKFGLSSTYSFHVKKMHYIDVSCFRFCRL